MSPKNEVLIEYVTNNGLTWIDIQKPTREKLYAIGKKYNFHELNIEDCLSEIQIPKIDKYHDHLFVILHFPIKEKGKQESTSQTSQLSIFIGSNYLVTAHQRDLKPLEDIFHMCSKSDEQRENLMGRSSGFLLHSIIDALVDDLFHILIKIVGNLHDLEDDVFNEQLAIAKEISLLRREITLLRRIVLPLKRIMAYLTNIIQKFSEEDLTLYYDDVRDHIDEIIEVLGESKETIEIYKDTDFMLSTEKTNKILAVLTIIFTLSIPAALVGAFYGMNITLPGGIETGSWKFFGPYTTLIVLILISIVPATVMLWYFRKLGWIRVAK
jgi:magnesium transporter